MPSWRCPHCSTPQPESSRCWVCHRSSTSCGTCRHFRGSVASRVGFCGLDRNRAPLRGDEVRPCWEDGAVAGPAAPVAVGLGLLEAPPLELGDGPVPAATASHVPDALRPAPVHRLRWVEVDAT